MEITNKVHLLEASKGSFCYLILGEEPVLIDTSLPGRAEKLVGEMQRIGVKPADIAHILLTHHDVDHIGNAKRLQELSQATLWAPKEDLPYIHGVKTPHGVRRIIKTFMRAETPTILNTYQAGQVIGGIEIIPTPGHTPGHVSLLLENTLFAGDLVTSSKNRLKPAPGFLTWDKQVLQRSLRQVGNLNFDWVCPAHGEPIQRGNLWEALMRR